MAEMGKMIISHCMYRSNTILFVFVILFGCTSNSDKSETSRGYYESGVIEYEAPLKNGRWHGIVRSYYPNGKLKAEVEWKNGVKDGEAVYFYANGNIESKGTFKNDTLKVGSVFLYSEDGSLNEHQIYDKSGNLVYYAEYNGEGKKTIDSVVPVIEAVKDTISLNEHYSALVSFGFKLEGKVKVDVGEIIDDVYKKSSHFIPDSSGNIHISYLPKKKGKNAVALRFHYKQTEQDTLNIDQMIVQHVFFVK